MPVTARLSKAFYDRLGEEIARELVDWFNQVDATYRSDLRELNELNFQRFDTRMEQRIVASERKLDARMAALERKLEARMAAFGATMERRMSSLENTLERRFGEQTRWMFAAWAALLIPIIGLWFQ
jgi:hypothetical protein